MERKSVLQKIVKVLSDGQPRTVRRVAFLAEVSLNAVREALRNGQLAKVGEEPKPCPLARRGQAIVGLPKEKKRCTKRTTPIAA
jgi:hypothetical protein